MCFVSLAGKELEEREIVTAQIISNWFANKRKEMKKIAREGLFFLNIVSLLVSYIGSLMKVVAISKVSLKYEVCFRFIIAVVYGGK